MVEDAERNELYKALLAKDAKIKLLGDAVAGAEEALGDNLQWLTDKMDLDIRQKDKDTLSRLGELNAAWKKLAKAKMELTRCYRGG